MLYLIILCTDGSAKAACEHLISRLTAAQAKAVALSQQTSAPKGGSESISRSEQQARYSALDLADALQVAGIDSDEIRLGKSKVYWSTGQNVALEALRVMALDRALERIRVALRYYIFKRGRKRRQQSKTTVPSSTGATKEAVTAPATAPVVTATAVPAAVAAADNDSSQVPADSKDSAVVSAEIHKRKAAELKETAAELMDSTCALL